LVSQYQGKILTRVGTNYRPAGHHSIGLRDLNRVRAVHDVLDGGDQTRAQQEAGADVDSIARLDLNPHDATLHATNDVG
jgi:hypothetical protein